MIQICVLLLLLSFALSSFRSYSNTRNHNRRSPTPSSTRSTSYHSPTRNPTPQGISSNFLLNGLENWFQFNIISTTVLSRPSSPAATARHSTHSPITNRSVQPKSQLTEDSTQTPSTQQVNKKRKKEKSMEFCF